MTKRLIPHGLRSLACSVLLIAASANAQLGLQIDAPEELEIVTAETIQIRASCNATGPNACAELYLCVAREPCTLLQNGESRVQDLREYAGTKLPLTFLARDASGAQTQSVERNFFVEFSTPLREVFRAQDGFVEAFDGSRALVLSDDRTRASIVTLAGATTEIVQASAYRLVSGTLGQVVLLHQAVSDSTKVLLWNGALTATEWSRAEAAGHWLAYLEREPVAPPGRGRATLTLRDLNSDETVWSYQEPDAAPCCGEPLPVLVFDFDLASNGELVIVSSGGIFWRHAGEGPLSPPGARDVPTSLVTDGVHAAIAQARFSTTYLLSRSGDVERLCQGWEFPVCGPVSLSGGWVAYTDFEDPFSPTTSSRAYRRSPGGSSTLLDTFPSPDARVGAMRDNGDLIVADGAGQRFLYTADGRRSQVLSPSQGDIFYRDGWYVVLGRSVFEVVFEPLPDDGGVDAGTTTVDAGETDGAAPDAGVADDAGEGLDAEAGVMDAAPVDAAWGIEAGDVEVEGPEDTGAGSEPAPDAEETADAGVDETDTSDAGAAEEEGEAPEDVEQEPEPVNEGPARRPRKNHGDCSLHPGANPPDAWAWLILALGAVAAARTRKSVRGLRATRARGGARSE